MNRDVNIPESQRSLYTGTYESSTTSTSHSQDELESVTIARAHPASQQTRLIRTQKGFAELTGNPSSAYLARKSQVQGKGVDSLAFAKFARPVGCGVNLFAAPVTPNRTGGGGPVFCGSSGVIAGCEGPNTPPVCCGGSCGAGLCWKPLVGW